MNTKDKQIQELIERVAEIEVRNFDLLEKLRRCMQENREIYEEFTRRIEEYQDSGPLSISNDEERVYYASKSRKHFHRPKCPWADYILISRNLIEFGSHAEAVQAGYKPCKTCKRIDEQLLPL